MRIHNTVPFPFNHLQFKEKPVAMAKWRKFGDGDEAPRKKLKEGEGKKFKKGNSFGQG